MRIYSGKSSKEVAVLKWHKEGCYTTAFATVDHDNDSGATSEEHEDEADTKEVLAPTSENSSVQQKRDQKAQSTHWLAAGSKDGKVSLWDIY